MEFNDLAAFVSVASLGHSFIILAVDICRRRCAPLSIS
jgi:hypothetical protein